MYNPVYTEKNIEVTNTSTSVSEADEVTKIYIPQEFTDDTATITIDYTITTKVGTTEVEDNCTKTIPIKSKFTKWEMGKKYTINLKFSLDEIYWDPTEEIWEDVASTDIEIK